MHAKTLKKVAVTSAALCMLTLFGCGSKTGPINNAVQETVQAQPTPEVPIIESSIDTNNFFACTHPFPGIRLSLEDEDSDDQIVRLNVVAVQELLRLMFMTNFISSDPGPADGVFGPMTDRAVREFQSGMRVKVDGLVGAQTWGTFQDACVMIQDEIDGHSFS